MAVQVNRRDFEAWWNTPGVGDWYTTNGYGKGYVQQWWNSLSPISQWAEYQRMGQPGYTPRLPGTTSTGEAIPAPGTMDGTVGSDLGAYHGDLGPLVSEHYEGKPYQPPRPNPSAAPRVPVTLPDGTTTTVLGPVPLTPAQPATTGALDKWKADTQKNLAAQQGYTNQYINDLTANTQRLGSTYDALNAREDALFADLRSALDGLSIPDSQAAQAYADPQSIAAQQQALGMLFGAASGANDVQTNPEDLARQKKAADKLWGLTDTEMTAQERYIMELARLGEERDRRAAMDAALRNLSARGQLGSGHEIGAMLGAQQTTSQNRLLQDLGAQANAIGRSMEALGMYTNLATAMRNASDAVSTGNMDRRVGAMNSAGNLSSNMRNASFNEAFSRGSAADETARARAVFERDKAGMIAGTGLTVTDRASNRADRYSGANLSALSAGFGANTAFNTAQTAATNNEFEIGRRALIDWIDAMKTDRAGNILNS